MFMHRGDGCGVVGSFIERNGIDGARDGGTKLHTCVYLLHHQRGVRIDGWNID